jgi:molybdopterin-containing oxidoreductase family iron-sulfur binding subunit
MRYGMVIDTKRCLGCFACTIACKSKNNLPNEKIWNRVECVGGEFYDTPSGTYEQGNLSMYYTPISCQHCAVPACMAVCPVEAIEKRDDGIVTQDNEKCIGCKLCIDACPYQVRTFNESEPEYYIDFPLGDWDAPKHKANTVEKCTYCANRVDRGESPACMLLCPSRARFWGDLDDPDSDVSKYLADRQGIQLLADKGTEPSCYYIM